MSKKKFSKTGIVLVGSMLVFLIICIVVIKPGVSGGKNSLDDENTPGITDIMDGSSPLLIFDKRSSTSDLMNAFDRGEVARVSIDCDEFSVSTQDQKEIEAIYRALKNILVGEEVYAKSNGLWGILVFEMEDGTNCEFEFAGESILVTEDGKMYKLMESDELWEVAKEAK